MSGRAFKRGRGIEKQPRSGHVEALACTVWPQTGVQGPILGPFQGTTMRTLYDSESFAVLHLLSDVPHDGSLPEDAPRLARHGFEIVDKRSGKELYLDGLWAEMFQQRIEAWQERTPTQEEVEDALEGYAELAQNPVIVH